MRAGVLVLGAIAVASVGDSGGGPDLSRPAAAIVAFSVDAGAAAARFVEPAASSASEPPATTSPPTTTTRAPGTVIAVGDSIMLAASADLQTTDGWIVTVDAKVGRQFEAGIPRLLAAAAQRPDRVVLHLGTNGPVSATQFDRAMSAVATVPRVIVLTVQLPDRRYPYESTTNEVIRRGAERWGAVLVDWNESTNDRPELFRADGYHLTPAGAALYVSLIEVAL